jgi:hypothetical protein
LVFNARQYHGMTVFVQNESSTLWTSNSREKKWIQPSCPKQRDNLGLGIHSGRKHSESSHILYSKYTLPSELIGDIDESGEDAKVM